MYITVAGFKGGVGKTTAAVHLACYFSQFGRTVLVDGDPNRSSMSWADRGSLPFAVCDFLASTMATQGADHVIIDTEAHPDPATLKVLASGCDLLVLPTTPDCLAMEATMGTVRSLRELRSMAGSFCVLLNKIDGRKTAATADARNAIASSGVPMFEQQITLLSAYEKAALRGVPVSQSRDRRAEQAWEEYQSLGAEIIGMVNKGENE